MKDILKNWLEEYFGSEEAVLLTVMLIASTLVLVTLGGILGPLFASLVITFLLQGIVTTMQTIGASRMLAISVAYVVFILMMLSLVIGVAPLIGRQTSVLVGETPAMLAQLQHVLAGLPEKYADYITAEQFNLIWLHVSTEAGRFAEQLLTVSINSFPGLVALLVYLFLVPLLVFFMLKDQQLLIAMVLDLLPKERPVLNAIWAEMDVQFANYIRGKAIEILVVGGTSLVAFVLLDLKYAALLALLVGLSVLIPYIGASLVTIPVLLVGYAQWGFGSEFLWLFFVYGVIQFLDGNLLVPLLFSEVVNLHPVAIIAAVLLFGGLWGFWGFFFAIPLATLVKAIYNAWPRGEGRSDGQPIADDA